jgi:hypothetical protein
MTFFNVTLRIRENSLQSCHQEDRAGAMLFSIFLKQCRNVYIACRTGYCHGSWSEDYFGMFCCVGWQMTASVYVFNVFVVMYVDESDVCTYPFGAAACVHS